MESRSCLWCEIPIKTSAEKVADFVSNINIPLDIDTLKIVSQLTDNKGEITTNILRVKHQNLVIYAKNPRQNPMGEHQREWFAIFLFLMKLFIFELLQTGHPVEIVIIILQQQTGSSSTFYKIAGEPKIRDKIRWESTRENDSPSFYFWWSCLLVQRHLAQKCAWYRHKREITKTQSLH